MEKEEREYIEAAQAEFNETIAIKELKEAAENAKTKVIVLFSLLGVKKCDILIERRPGTQG